MVRSSSALRAFTLVEMLVVILIITILMGLLIPAVGLLRGSADVVNTRAILALVTQGLSSSGVERGTNIATVEHPLAATAIAPTGNGFAEAPRGVFSTAAGVALPTTGNLIMTSMTAADRSDASWTAGDENRILRRDDRFNDPLAPQYIGVERWQMRVVSIAPPWISQVERVDRGTPPGDIIATPLTKWVNEGFMSQTITDRTETAWEDGASKSFSVALAAVLDELVNLKAVSEPDTDSNGLIHYGRLRSWTPADGVASSGVWRPGMVNDEGGGTWRSYRVRGPSLVDTWGREILVSRTPNGAFYVESAGPDGSFRWLPGEDGEVTTQGAATVANGDDLPATVDNIRLGMEE